MRESVNPEPPFQNNTVFALRFKRNLSFHRILFFLITGVFSLSLISGGQEQSKNLPEQPKNPIKPQKVYRMTVLGKKTWTETGLDVSKGQIIHFEAEGGMSLQMGNPIAYCGPEGYSMKTVQQPVEDKNIGALIGKVVKLLSIEEDEETGEEIRNEKTELFYIGPENEVRMPLSGKLHLGINEDVTEDNDGEYRVKFYLEKDAR